jgi:hypothetical protein
MRRALRLTAIAPFPAAEAPAAALSSLMPRLRGQLAVVLLAGLLGSALASLAHLVLFLGETGPNSPKNTPYDDVFARRKHWSPDAVPRFFERMAPLRGAVPTGARVAYATDTEGQEALMRYVLTRAALPPALVVREPERPPSFLIADFRSARALERRLRGGPWRVVERPRRNLALLRRRSPRP